MKKIIVTLGIIFVVANVVDILLTWAILDKGGVELNPIMAFIIEGGFWKAIAFKVGLPVVIAVILIRKQRLASLAILATAFVAITIWNVIGLLAI